MKQIFLIFCLILFYCTTLNANMLAFSNWQTQQKAYSLFRLRNAISPVDGSPGSIFASPSRHFPNYYYTWIRDGALALREIFAIIDVDSEIANQLLKDYIIYSRNNQLSQNLSGRASGLGLGEPKFNMDGSPFNAPWGRPQNDGPALRAYLIADYTYNLWQSGDQNYVFNNLYRAELPANTLLKADLEYIAHHWQDQSFDLWEEFKGDHFYTRMIQWKALLKGTQIAKLLNDEAAASFYLKQADLIYESLKLFWSENKNFIKATINYSENNNYKNSELDIAIILAVIQVGNITGPFSITDDKILKTALALEKAFAEIYLVNEQKYTHDGESIGAAIGRYPEDRYDGYRTNKLGNPWYLTTLAMAEFYYKLSLAVHYNPQIISNETFNLFLTLQSKTDTNLIARNKNLAEIFKIKGDTFLKRIQFHTDDTGHFSEQFNRFNGISQGARDLTWSYAAFLSCIRAKNKINFINP
ncbi:MAG: glycoside hydrolase family 15 protein [bacterium]|nr:glycoside hydrolase family 15 protein [bacterium]